MRKNNKGKQLFGRKYYNKTEFGKKWTEITKKQTRNLDQYDVEFIRSALTKLTKYRRIATDPKTKLKIGTKKFQKYEVRGIILISPNSKSEIWIGKKQMMTSLFPVKKKKVTSDDTMIKMAFRQLVSDFVKQERTKQLRYAFAEGNVKCPLSGVNLTECEEGTDLDHVYPFSKMVADFYRKYNLYPERIEWQKIGTSVRIKDKSVSELWVDYHNTNADLKLTCRKANRKKSDKVI